MVSILFIELYQYAVKEGDCITYAGIPMYEKKVDAKSY